MSVNLNETQVEKFRALGRAARSLAAEYKVGAGPDPVSGHTFQNGQAACTWGQLLHRAGFQAGSMSSGDNLGCFAGYIGESKVKNINLASSVKTGMFSDKVVEYDISKIKEFGTKIMQANDPAPTAAARKAATWKLLDQLADEVEKVFGEPEAEQTFSFESAAEQHLQNLLLGIE